MFRAGAFVADNVRPVDEEPLGEQQVQPNGVDLTVERVLVPAEAGRIGRDGKTVADRRAVEPVGDDRTYELEPGGYVVQYGEVLSVPEEHVGFVLPRSSLLRNGATLETAVWDAGYEGGGEGLLRVTHPIEIEQGARIAQFVLAGADHEGVYDGAYQGERLE